MKPILHGPYFWWVFGAAVLMSVVFTILKNVRISFPGFRNGKGNQRVTFSFSGRDGQAYYTGPEGSFDMYMQFGGGDVLVILSVPTPQNWESETGIPLERREAVLQFIGQQGIDTQNAGRGSFKIQDDAILFYS